MRSVMLSVVCEVGEGRLRREYFGQDDGAAI